MSKELPFVIYCIEGYKNQKKMNGRETFALFDRYQAIDYIRKFYEFLHTTGINNIIDDIDQYIESQKEKEQQ